MLATDLAPSFNVNKTKSNTLKDFKNSDSFEIVLKKSQKLTCKYESSAHTNLFESCFVAHFTSVIISSDVMGNNPGAGLLSESKERQSQVQV